MRPKALGLTLMLAVAAAAPTSASAQREVVVGLTADPKVCNAKTAIAADLGEVAYGPAPFVGKCVSLQGYWRDLAIYPTRAEAAQPDARSMSFLDRRRIGLYLTPKDDAAAPTAPAPARVIGVVGVCAKLLMSGAEVKGYCSYKAGAFLAVASITLDR